MKPGTLSALALLAPLWLTAPVKAENPAPNPRLQETYDRYPGSVHLLKVANLDSPIIPALLKQNQDNSKTITASESAIASNDPQTEEKFQQLPTSEAAKLDLSVPPVFLTQKQDDPQEEPASESVGTPTAQQTDAQIQQLQQRLRGLDEVPLQPIYLGAPGTSANTPTAFGGGWGSVGAGVSFQERTRYTDTSDGTAGLVVSFGNPQETVGLDVGVTALDLSDYGDRGSFNFKVHRVLPHDFGVAVGLENALVWGFSDADTSAYGVVSKKFRLQESTRTPFSRLNLSVGVGNGRFRSEDDVQDGNEGVNVFGSAAIQVIEPIGIFTEWTGQDLNVGASIVPFRNLPLVITPTLSDIAGNAGDGTRFTVGVGYGFSLF